MKESLSRKVLAFTAPLLFRYGLAFGFALFLTGLFIFPSGHNYKVALNYLLMIPALLACTAMLRWWPALRKAGWLPVMVLIYLVYMTANSLLQNRSDGVEFVLWSIYIATFLIAIGLCMDIPSRVLCQLLWGAALVAAIASAYAIGRDYFSGLMQQTGYRLIGYGALYNPLRTGHLLGAFAIIAVWCGCSCGMSTGLSAPVFRWQRYVAMLMATIIFVAILFTDSRAPLLALLGVAVCMVLSMTSPRRRWGYLVAIASIAIFSIGFFGERLSERGLSLRPELWWLSLHESAANLWFGVGLGRDIAITSVTGVPFFDTHNIFISALYHGGVIGLVLFCALFFGAVWIAWRDRKKSTFFALAAALQLFGIATLQFDGGSLIGRPTEFWMLYWLPIALTLFAQRQSS